MGVIALAGFSLFYRPDGYLKTLFLLYKCEMARNINFCVHVAIVTMWSQIRLSPNVFWLLKFEHTLFVLTSPYFLLEPTMKTDVMYMRPKQISLEVACPPHIALPVLKVRSRTHMHKLISHFSISHIRHAQNTTFSTSPFLLQPPCFSVLCICFYVRGCRRILVGQG